MKPIPDYKVIKAFENIPEGTVFRAIGGGWYTGHVSEDTIHVMAEQFEDPIYAEYFEPIKDERK